MTAPDALNRFLVDFPDYSSTAALDELRAAEYSRLDDGGHTYLDYTGACLYAASQVREHTAWMASGLFGNPHSGSPASSAATAAVEHSRREVLRWFNGTRDYVCVFTQNASAALKLVGESYPFTPGGRLLLTADNHNSVNGVRQYALAKGATVEYAGLTFPELRLDRDDVLARLAGTGAPQRSGAPRLFAFPAQ